MPTGVLLPAASPAAFAPGRAIGSAALATDGPIAIHGSEVRRG
jgi:hypothetical protein